MAEGLLLGGAGLPEGCLGLGRVLCWLYHLPPCLLMRRQFLNQFLCLFVCDSESQTGCLALTLQHRGKMHLSGSGTAVLCCAEETVSHCSHFAGRCHSLRQEVGWERQAIVLKPMRGAGALYSHFSSGSFSCFSL